MEELHETYIKRYLGLAAQRKLPPVESQSPLLLNLTPWVDKYVGGTAEAVFVGADSLKSARVSTDNFKMSNVGTHVARVMTQVLSQDNVSLGQIAGQQLPPVMHHQPATE